MGHAAIKYYSCTVTYQDSKRLCSFQWLRHFAKVIFKGVRQLYSWPVGEIVFLEVIPGKVKRLDCIECSLYARHCARHCPMCCHVLMLTVQGDRLITGPGSIGNLSQITWPLVQNCCRCRSSAHRPFFLLSHIVDFVDCYCTV